LAPDRGVAEGRKNYSQQAVAAATAYFPEVVSFARGGIPLPAKRLLGNFLPVRCELSQLRANIQTNQYVDALPRRVSLGAG
jgi:hypothetical protein